MGKCFSKIKVKPALESGTETDTKSRGWKSRVRNSLCMGKHSAAVEPCGIKETFVNSESGHRQPAENETCVNKEDVVKSEFDLGQSAEDACVIQDVVVKSESGLKPLADDACVIKEAVFKSEFGLKPLADDACVIQEAVVKSDSQRSQESQMFGIDELPRVAQTPKMDFAIYLLPSSPPASKNGFSCLALSPEASKNGEEESQEIAEKEKNYEGCMNGVNLGPNVNNQENLRKHRHGIKPIIVKKDPITSDSETSETSANSERVTPIRPSFSRSSRVSFADDKGFALETVHIMTEPSGEPPCIAADENWSFTNGIEPPYKLAFSQPAADYMGFREKVDRCRVSLENVILSGYQVQGTIKVKNICFEKRVFVRVTFDSWITCQDVEAEYVQPYAGNTVNNFDTFSFQFEIDTRSDTNKNVNFAVCFETPTGQNWDNNRGANYEIIPHESADCLEDNFFKG